MRGGRYSVVAGLLVGSAAAAGVLFYFFGTPEKVAGFHSRRALSSFGDALSFEDALRIYHTFPGVLLPKSLSANVVDHGGAWTTALWRQVRVCVWACLVRAPPPQPMRLAQSAGAVLGAVTGQPVLRAKAAMQAGLRRLVEAMATPGAQIAALQVRPGT